jgi:hypothetical protein
VSADDIENGEDGDDHQPLQGLDGLLRELFPDLDPRMVRIVLGLDEDDHR